MPVVVGSEAWLHNTLKEPIEADISARYEELEDSLSFTAMVEGASDMVSDMFSDDDMKTGKGLPSNQTPPRTLDYSTGWSLWSWLFSTI